MFEWAESAMDTLWHNGLAAIPLVVVAAAASRFLPCLPATRHLIWVTVLIWLVGAPLLPQAPVALVSASITTIKLDVQGDQSSSVNSEGIVKNSTPKKFEPRKLTSRLAKKEQARRAEKVASKLSESSAGSAKRNITWHSDEGFDGNSIPPPPRYAARAEDLAPDKLAPARGTAGPRSQSAVEMVKPSLATPQKNVVPLEASTSTSGGKPDRSVAYVRNDTDLAFEKTPLYPPLLRGEAHAAPALTAPAQTSPAHATAAQTAPANPAKDAAPKQIEAKEAGAGSGELKVAAPREQDAIVPWQQWAAAIVGVRDAVSQVPPIPRYVWLGGTGLLLVLALGRVLSFRRRLRHARPAPREVQAVVESACASLGLRSLPQILMVEGRVSPMVWCGVTPKLILPTALWDQLDELGRKAVVFHELAHIRRLDHRTAWIESAIGMLYWWHPLVWWVRGRLHAEAENCCDAWVMTLLPKTRRAYATALLKRANIFRVAAMPCPQWELELLRGERGFLRGDLRWS